MRPQELPLAEVLYAVGRHLLSEEQLVQAADVFRALVTRAPEDERGWLGLSECHRLHGEHWIACELLAVARLYTGHAPHIDAAAAWLLHLDGQDTSANDEVCS